MVKRIFALAILIFLTLPIGIYAQETVSLSNLEVDLWPEYDRPNMLVIYHATLSPEISPPVDVTFRIPVEAGNPNAVAVRQLDGSLYSVAYDRQVNGDWGLITFTATSPEVQLEYYDPSLELQSEQRHYEYVWPGDYAVQNLVIKAQQPVGASEIRFSPSMNSSSTGQDGMVYYATEVGSLAAGDTFSIAMDYRKSNDVLSVEQFEVQPSAPLPPDANAQAEWIKYLPWVLGVLGIALIAGGGYWYWQQSRDEQPATKTRRRRRATQSDTEAASTEEGVYCHHCGKRANASDKFCRACGTRLRTE